jgi:hypothetical protein
MCQARIFTYYTANILRGMCYYLPLTDEAISELDLGYPPTDKEITGV